jgi:hypothetical protein
MYRIVLGLAAVLPLSAAPVWSQQQRVPRMDSRPRVELERRFAERVRQELRLTDEQAARLHNAVAEHTKRRDELSTQAHALRAALADQLRPGVAADNDSVARLTDELVGLRLRYAESFRREWGELSKFLTPVQRARFLVMRERVVRAAREIRERRGTPSNDRRMDGRRDERRDPRRP